MVDGIWKQFSMDMTAKQPGLGTIEGEKMDMALELITKLSKSADVKMHYVFPEKCYFFI